MEVDKLEEATLRRLGLESVGPGLGQTFEVVATLLAPHEETLEEPMLESIATHLAARANKAIEEKKDEGRSPAGIVSARVDYSDHATCEDAEGRSTNAFVAGLRCYRVVLLVATEDAA